MKATKHRECVTVAPFVVKPTTQKSPPSLRGGHAGTLHERCGQASRSFRPTPQTKIWSNFVQSYFVRTLAYGTWLRSLINAPCLDWSRFGRSGQKTNTASCVYSAMIEGMRYKVYLLLQGLAGAPCYGYGQSSLACTVSGLESIRAFPSGSLHGIIWYLAPRRA